MKTENQKRIEEIYSPVRIVDTTEILTDSEMQLMPYNNKAVIVTKPNGKDICVNFCSNIYALIPNTEIFPNIEKALSEHFDFKPTYKHWNFSKFYVDYEITETQTHIGETKNVDVLKPMIRVMHSYNGQLRYKMMMGFKRLICENGLWGFVSDVDFILKHTTENSSNIFNKSIDSVISFINNVEEAKENYEVLRKNKIKVIEERVDQVLEKVTLFPKRQRNLVIERVEQEYHKNHIPITDWAIYNGFNFQLNHNKEIKSQEDQKMDIDKSIYKFLLKSAA